MNLHITYLSSRSGSSVIVQINGNKYVFNVFEGFQRYMIEKKKSLKGIKAFFIPHEKSIPPFIGTYLTLRDGGAKTLNVVCSSHSSEIIEGANGFCPRNNLKLIYNSSYSDQYINAEIIYNHINKGVKKEKIVYEDTDSSVVDFLLQIKNIRGSLIVDKIPEEIPKQYYSKLTKKEIFEHNGIEYNGKDYLEEDIEIGKIMFVFSEYKLEPLLEKIEEVRIIFCFNAKAYSLFKKLHKNTFLCSTNRYVDFVFHYKIQSDLSLISSDFLLPLSKFNVNYGRFATNRILQGKSDKYKNLSLKRPLKFNYKLRYLNLKDFKCSLRSGDEFLFYKNLFKIKRDRITGYKRKINKFFDNSLLFLGTGCALPSKYRNVSSVMYKYDGKIILLDCGEDTLHQIDRVFGSLVILERLYMIFISHSHGDHSLGVISVIKQTKHKIFLIAPTVLIEFLKKFNLTNVTYIETDICKKLENNFYKEIEQNENIMNLDKNTMEKYTLNVDLDVKITICGCVHNKDSCSISIINKKNKISYSGDTVPSFLFALIAKNSTVLIHESTFDESNAGKASITKHSTIVDANYIFDISKSETLLLTHFSQRYPKGFVSKYEGIPAMDFWRFAINKNSYDKEKIDKYLSSLDE